MIPDKQIPWYRAAVARGREVLKREKFDLLFASLEPRTCLLVAARLSRETGIPCVFEYRDLWTGNPYYHITQPTGWHRSIHQRLERRALKQARRVSAVCRGIADYLAQRHGSAIQGTVALNYNFFVPEEYPPAERARGSRPFTVSYAGAMYEKRSPDQFFEGLRAFIDRARLTPEQFRFRWVGFISGISNLAESLERNGLRPYIDFHGQVSHREALRQLVESDVALLLQAPQDVIHIPGKLFEAMGARVPLLTLANPCETVEIITRCRAGLVCSHNAASVADALGEFHRLHARGGPWEFNETELERFSAKTAMAKLVHLFEEALP